ATASPSLPPRVPISVNVPRSQRNGCWNSSPVRFIKPTTAPRLFSPSVPQKAPPSLPRSIIRPYSQRNGCNVGSPVVSFGSESVYETPATCPRSFTNHAELSGPPKVPSSCITPFSQRKTRVCVVKNRLPRMGESENSSGIELAAPPTTCPQLLTCMAMLPLPPNVPKLMISPSFQRTATASG